MINVLFICSRNQWRSPTAEQIFRRHPSITARSAGTSRNAKKRVTTDLLLWSDIICVMEQQHKNRLVAEYRQAIASKPLHVLDIPDEYRFMDPELIVMITDIVTEKLGLYA